MFTGDESIAIATDPDWKVSDESKLLAENMRTKHIARFSNMPLDEATDKMKYTIAVAIQKLKRMSVDEIARYTYLTIGHAENGTKIPLP